MELSFSPMGVVAGLQGYEGGFFVGGTLFDRVRMDMSILTPMKFSAPS